MKSLLVFGLIFFSLMSCATREVSPTRDSKIAIDTIYQQKVSQMQAGLDSMCVTYMDSIYRYAVDSMLKEREAEMQQLIK